MHYLFKMNCTFGLVIFSSLRIPHVEFYTLKSFLDDDRAYPCILHRMNGETYRWTDRVI